MNKAILIGNLGRAPEIRVNNVGSKVIKLSVATSKSWKDKQSGERRSKSEWHTVVCFNQRFVGLAEKVLRKGSTVAIEGEIQTRKWTDQSGVEKYTTEIIIDQFNGTIDLVSQPGTNSSSQNQGTQDQDPGYYGGDDDYPF